MIDDRLVSLGREDNDKSEDIVLTTHKEYNLFENFKQEMYSEYLRHYPKQKDSWKTCKLRLLINLLYSSVDKPSLEELRNNPTHFIDVANFALFCYYRFSESREK